jgi:hypothetical protein
LAFRIWLLIVGSAPAVNWIDRSAWLRGGPRACVAAVSLGGVRTGKKRRRWRGALQLHERRGLNVLAGKVTQHPANNPS